MQFKNLALLALSAVSAIALPTAEPVDSVEAPAGLVARGDGYPYDSSCGGVDPWHFYKCQCTSYVAYKLNQKGIKFTNQYKGQHWGNANTWDEAARASGVSINSTPRVGAVAQSNAGSAGHVAWVASVGDSTVTVHEYNYNVREGYGSRTVSKGSFNYIHI